MEVTEKPWDIRILERLESGVDGTLIQENLALTPMQRLEKMQKMLSFVEEVRANRGIRSSKAS